NNGGWGIDVLHKEGFYSGGGLMLTNTHLYANGNGMRTESGAIIPETIESCGPRIVHPLPLLLINFTRVK
ncbi:hypothetical protein, partial [Serratia sp. Se-RSmG]|uniref:hypothetical protein n=1 Tax=Serratia sp. Se-RSmG TaxID=3043307 RepID=UPI0024AF6E9B